MKILLVSGPGISLKEPYNSGIEAFIVSFANQLVCEGHTVDVIAAEAEAKAKFLVINPFTPSVTDEQPGFFTRLKQTRQFKNLDLGAYDIIHYNMFYPHLLNAGLCFDKTSFLTLHSPVDKKRTSVYRKLSERSHLQFVAISQRVKRQWDNVLRREIPLIPNGIDLSLWPANRSRSSEYLLWSARINNEKNAAAAIQVAKQMQLPLKIAGKIADQVYFDKEVKPHLDEQIEYVGHLTQRKLSCLAQRASVYMATATWPEPFGLAALEMLASGVPVVAFDTAVPPDWTHESISKTSSLHWQDLIELVEKSNAVSSLSCEAFASNMSIKTMTSGYLKLYKEAITDKNRGENSTGSANNFQEAGIQHL